MFSRKRNALVLAFVLGGLTLYLPAQSQTYDAAADFAISNPNGVWSYGSKTSLNGPLTLYNASTTRTYGGTVDWLYNSSLGLYPGVFYNDSGSPFVYPDPGPALPQLPGELRIHAGANEVSVVEWTAPNTGLYAVNADFYGVTTDTTDVYVLNNGNPLFAAAHAGIADLASYSGLVSVTTGNTIDFAIDNGGNGNRFDYTGLRATIAAVPEPSSIALLLAGGLTGAGLFLRRRRKQLQPQTVC